MPCAPLNSQSHTGHRSCLPGGAGSAREISSRSPAFFFGASAFPSAAPKLAARFRARLSALRRALRLRSGGAERAIARSGTRRSAIAVSGVPEPPNRRRFASPRLSVSRDASSFFFSDVSDPPAISSPAASRAYGRAPGGAVAGDTGHGPPCAPSSPPSFLAQTCRTSPSRSTSADETAYPSSLSVTAVASHARPRSATIASASGARGAERERAGGRYHTQRFSGARRSTGIRRASMLRRRRAAFPRSASFPRSAGKWGVDGDAVVGIVCVRYP